MRYKNINQLALKSPSKIRSNGPNFNKINQNELTNRMNDFGIKF